MWVFWYVLIGYHLWIMTLTFFINYFLCPCVYWGEIFFPPFVSRFYNCSSVYLGFITVQVDLCKHTHTPTQHACCCLSLPSSMFILSISLSRSVSACQSISVCEGLRNVCPPVKLKLEGTQVVLIFSSYFLSGVREEQWWSHKSGQKKTREERAVLITHQRLCNK